MVLDLVSLNVNGLQCKAKRRAIFKTCRSAKHEFCLLQETHSTLDIETLWRSEWGSQIIFAHGDSNSRGVAILVRKGSEYAIDEIAADPEGRVLLLKITKDQESFLLGNVYAPTQDHPGEQAEFIDSLEEMVVESGEPSILLGGDFNLCLNTSLDRASSQTGMTNRGAQHKERVISFMDTLKLADSWRKFNQGTKCFTFRRGPQASRLDYWMVSEHLLTSETKVGISREPLSDHDSIYLRIGQTPPRKGPGVWRIDNALLTNPDYANTILEVINEVKDNEELTDDCAKWEWLKYRIRKTSIQFSKQLYQKVKGHELSLRHRLAGISEELDQASQPSDNDLTELNSLKREISEIELTRANRTIMAARTNWAIGGERPTRYFLNLQKIQARDKAITELINEEGQSITDHADILAEEQKFYRALYCQVRPDEDLGEVEQLGLQKESVPTLSTAEAARLEEPYPPRRIS